MFLDEGKKSSANSGASSVSVELQLDGHFSHPDNARDLLDVWTYHERAAKKANSYAGATIECPTPVRFARASSGGCAISTNLQLVALPA